MIPHNMTLFKFICVQYQFHRQTLPIMKIDRGQIQFREYVSTGMEPQEWGSARSKIKFSSGITERKSTDDPFLIDHGENITQCRRTRSYSQKDKMPDLRDERDAKQTGGDLTQSYDKSPYTNKNVKRAKWQHKQRYKKFD